MVLKSTCIWVSHFFFFFFWEKHFTFSEMGLCFFSGSRVMFTGPTSTLFRKKKNFKIGSHNTIHTFKNYFTTIFSIFSKINSIQTDLSTTLPSIFMGVITFKSVRMKIKIISSHLFFFQGSTRYKWNWSDNQLIVRLFVLFGI